MHFSRILASAAGLALAWAAPADPVIDKSPATIPLDKLKLSSDLKVLRPKIPRIPGKVDFGLKKRIALNWEDDEDTTRAELTANWDEQEEIKVINMADFGTALEKVDCTAPSMSLDFKQAGPYNEAKASWGWVNIVDKNTIILFVDHPDCGADKAETPFRVTGIKYDDTKFIVYLTVAEIQDLEAVIPDGELVIETLADVGKPAVKARRDDSATADAHMSPVPLPLRKRISKSTTINLSSDFSNRNLLTAGSGGDSLKLDCLECGTRGKIRVKLYAKISWFKVKRSYVEFRAEDVQAFLNLKLYGKGSRTAQGRKTLVPITAFGFNIPKIATLRIAADIGVGWDAGFNGEGEVTWGATASLTNPSVWKECFRGCDDEKTGWEITTAQRDPTGKGSLNAKLGIHAFVTPKAEARIFGAGYEVGVAILAPKLEGTATVSGNTRGGVCANPLAVLGIDIDVKIGLECYVYAGDNYQSPNWRKTLFERMWTLYDKCYTLAKMSIPDITLPGPVRNPTITLTRPTISFPAIFPSMTPRPSA